MRDDDLFDLGTLGKGYPEFDPEQARGENGKWTGGWGTSARSERRRRQKEREAAEREGRPAPKKPSRAKAPKKPATTEGKPRAKAPKKPPAKAPEPAPARRRRPRPTPPPEVTIGELKPQDPVTPEPPPAPAQPETPFQAPVPYTEPEPPPRPTVPQGLIDRDRKRLDALYERYDALDAAAEASMNEYETANAAAERAASAWRNSGWSTNYDPRTEYSREAEAMADAANQAEDRARVARQRAESARARRDALRNDITELENKLRGATAKRFRKVDKPLYLCRYLKNADDFTAWAKASGFKTVAAPDELHATVAYSKRALPWPKARESNVVVRAADGRAIKRFGDAVVMTFPSQILTDRWQQMLNRGASWDHPEYQPHVTISYNVPADMDLSKVRPFQGPLLFGPEHMEEITKGYRPAEKRTAKHLGFRFHKDDKELGLVFGWAIVCNEDGEPYYDTQGDHIPEDSMLRAAAEFMNGRRTMKIMHSGKAVGKVVFAWPMTEDIADAMGVKGERSGLMVAIKPDSPSVLQRFRDGRYTGFSIGGNRLVDEDVDDDDD